MDREFIRLLEVGFDNLENRDAEYKTDHGTFVSDDKSNAHVKVDQFLRALIVRPYLGWDGEVYPKFKCIKGVLK